MAVVTPIPTREGQYVLLTLALPGTPEICAGVLLLDTADDTLHFRLRRDWREVAPEEDAEILELLEADFESKTREMGGEAFLHWLEDTASNILRVSGRETVSARDVPLTLERLYRRYVEGVVEQARFVPFETHVPVYSLRAAATKFGEDMEVEAEGWTELPAGVRPSARLFVAQVVGRSMEPRIPDGSYCLFRAHVGGSRSGMLLLVRRKGASHGGGEFTVKRYQSRKAVTEEGWERLGIRLEPLNPEFEAWELASEEEFEVLGEFVQVLDSPEIVSGPER